VVKKGSTAAKPAEKAAGAKKSFTLPDFSKMSQAEKLQWNLDRIRRM